MQLASSNNEASFAFSIVTDHSFGFDRSKVERSNAAGDSDQQRQQLSVSNWQFVNYIIVKLAALKA